MVDPRAALAELIAKLSADGDLSDGDLRQIHDAAVAQTDAILADRRWAEAAHVHDAPHLPVITLRDDGGEDVDASAIICHDCRRDLVSDAGTVPLLVCPTLHGRRPAALLPGPGGAVECGRP